MTPESKPRISVVVCTYRRPEFLQDALDSLGRQAVPPDRFEVIVVDNNSGPPTPEVVHEYARHCSYELKYVLQEAPGISNARNAGIAAARSDVVAFLDDDEVAYPKWVASHVDAYKTMPEAAAVAGRVWLIWNTPRPDWLARARAFGELGMIDWGNERHILEYPQYLGTGNSSFKKEAFDHVGLFDVGLPRGEDTDMERRLKEAGYVIVYAPDSIIYHQVPTDKVRRRFFYGAAFRRGQQRVRLQIRKGIRQQPNAPGRDSESEAANGGTGLRRMVAPVFRTAVRLASGEGGWTNSVRQMCYFSGILYESIGLRLRRRR